MLEQRVIDFVAANPGLTAREVAKGVTARLQSVIDVLSGEAFSAAPRDAYPSDRAQVYRLAPVAAEQPGRAARRSQCDLIADLLADGLWHSVAQIHRRCGFSRLNSRVAELRSRRGMTIECRHVTGAGRGADAYEYRAVTSEGGDGVAAMPLSSSPSGAPVPADLSLTRADPSAGAPARTRRRAA